MGRRTPVHVEVVIHDQSQVERMIKKFTRKCKKSGLFDELKERRHFTKKSVKNKEKRARKKRLSKKSTQDYKDKFNKLPVICLSVSENKTYYRTDNDHPVLGIEYSPDESSLTEQYFKKMGFEVRYFMPPNCVAPLAFYFFGDLLNDYTNLELISTISTMTTFQKIYRPEIYNANAVAGRRYKPKLKHSDHSLTQIIYDLSLIHISEPTRRS